MNKGFLILGDGTVFEGLSIGVEGSSIGETVFTTGMTGYIETLTDPSYFGQIVTQTFPLIGNYGLMEEDFESSKSWVRGYIIRELCDSPSNFRCQNTLDSFLKKQNIVGICGLDTRALTKKLRESGVMNGMICSGLNMPIINEELLSKINDYKIRDAVKNVGSETKVGETKKNKTGTKNVILWDFGTKGSIERELENQGCTVTVVPFNTTAEQIINQKPDGIMLSNGPGDPTENSEIISEIKKICEWNLGQQRREGVKAGSQIPIFGICLGYQLLALARGAKTIKLKYGHRGANHPVKDISTGRVYITSQNHGYAVESATLPNYAKESFININDGTCEGITYTDILAFSVQFHPEACGGPHDTKFLFNRFLEKMEVRHGSE